MLPPSLDVRSGFIRALAAGLQIDLNRRARHAAIRRASGWRLPYCGEKETIMEKDVVCGMQVDPARAAGTSEYNGRTYYFCSKACKAKFDANPGQYVK
jgi:Cu+-exporting ATPase